MLINIIIGLIFIGLGFLVVKYPMLIAGYNTMSAEKKENVDIVAMSVFLRKMFVILGLVFILLSLLGYVIDKNVMDIIKYIFTFLFVIYIFIKAQKYDQNKGKKNQIVIILIIVIFVAILISMLSSSKPAKITFSETAVTISGMYGQTIDYKDIENIKLIDQLPKINRKTNGYSLGSIRKGYFKLNGIEKAKLYVDLKYSPYLVIETKDHNIFIINRKEKEDLMMITEILMENNPQLNE